MVFPIVMYGCESCTIKKAEHWRIDTFELCCWRKLLRVPWTARRSNQSILKDISLEYLLEWLMLKLKLQYFCHLMKRADSFEKTLMLGKIEGKRRRGQQRMTSLTQWTWVWVGSGVSDGQEGLVCCSPWVTKSQTGLSNWTELNWTELLNHLYVSSVGFTLSSSISDLMYLGLLYFFFMILDTVFPITFMFFKNQLLIY